MPKKAVPGSAGIQKKTRADGSVVGYVATYRDPTSRDKNGEAVSRNKTFRTLVEAKAFRVETLQSIKTGRYITPDRGRTTWAEVSSAWLDDMRPTLRRRTVEGYEHLLGRHLGRWDNIAVADITRDDVRKLIADIRQPREPVLSKTGRAIVKGKPEGLSQETENKIFSLVRQVFDYATEERYIDLSPAAGRRRRRKEATQNRHSRALTRDEAQAIIGHLPEGRYRLFGQLALSTGLRPGELAGLRVRNLNVEDSELQVDETVEHLRAGLHPGVPKTKGSRWRIVDVPMQVMTELSAYVKGRGLGADDYVFAEQGPFFVYKMFERRQWQAALKAAGYTDGDAPRFYDLRHTFATLHAEAGTPPHVLMYLLGHSNIKTTMNVYVHGSHGDPAVKAIVERLYGSEVDSAPLASDHR